MLQGPGSLSMAHGNPALLESSFIAVLVVVVVEVVEATDVVVTSLLSPDADDDDADFVSLSDTSSSTIEPFTPRPFQASIRTC